MNPPLFPYGHFYSPIVDADEIAGRADAIWNENTALAGIDLNDARHVEILQAWFPKFIGEYDYPDEGDPNNPAGYFNLNDQFSWLDARALFVFLRHLQPKRVVEVGSGFSSLLIADVNHRFLGERMEFTCVEPYPREFLRRGMAGLTRLVDQKAQDVGFAVFDSLEAGGFLFIDSSHVAKTGSDVNFLFFDVLPRLKAGVFVHVHDIFLPMEYPRERVIEQNRSWNEQYLLRALLMFSRRFRVVFGAAHAAQSHGPAVVKALARPDGHGMGGGSFWIEVIDDRRHDRQPAVSSAASSA